MITSNTRINHNRDFFKGINRELNETAQNTQYIKRAVIIISIFLSLVVLSLYYRVKNISFESINFKNREFILLLFSSFSLSCIISFIFSLYLEKKSSWKIKRDSRLLLSIFTILIGYSIGIFFPSLSEYTIFVLLSSMIVSLVLNLDIAIFLITIYTLFFSLLLEKDNIFLFTLYFTAITVGILVRKLKTRADIIRMGLWAGIVAFFCHAGISIYNGLSFTSTVHDAFFFFGNGVMAGFIFMLVLPFIEYLFDIVTDISLLELSDHNNELLRTLLIKAPGTYQHSLLVGNLAEEAARAIGANPLLARVGAYYHDIGKMIRPEYFTENEFENKSKHEKLSPVISSLIIMSHPKDGYQIATDYKLPSPIKKIIIQHHGTTSLSFFLKKAQSLAEKGEKVDEYIFRYPGPKPDTAESVIVMLADSVEAATRSFVKPSPTRIKEVVSSIINQKIQDGQLDESPLTLHQVAIVRDTFIRILTGMYHSRVRYPDAESNK